MRKSFFAIACSLALSTWSTAFGAISVNAPTSSISADQAANAASPAWTSLGAITIREAGGPAGRNDLSTGTNQTIVLKAPAGFEFNTGITPSISGTSSDIGSISVAVTDSTTLTVTLTVIDIGDREMIRIGSTTNIQIRPTSGSPLAPAGTIYTPTTGGGTLTVEGLITTDNIDGSGGTSFGSLSEIAGTVARLAFTTQPDAVTAGANFGTQPVIKAQDQFGNDSITGLGATMNITNALSQGTGALQGTRTNNIGTGGGNGTITFTDLRLDTTGTNKQLSVTAPGLASAISSNFTVDPAAANKLSLQIQPSSSATQGVAFAQQPVIWIEDQFGNLRTSDTLVVTAARSAGNGILQGTTAIAAVGGVVAYTDLAHDIVTNITIAFTSAGLNSVTSSVVTLNKADQTIAFGPLGNRTYGDAAFGLIATASSALPVTFSISSGPATISNGTNVNITGTGTVVVRASQAGNANYNAAPDVDQSFAVSKAMLTVTSTSTNRVYGAINPTFTGSINGLQYSDSITATYSTTATSNSPVGNYTITQTLNDPGSKLDNYTVTTNNGALTITAATLTVTANDTNRVYGAINPVFTAGYTGFVNGEDESVLAGSPILTTSADETSGVGSHVIAAAAGTLAATNYNFIFANGTLSITKAGLTVTVDNKSKVYGDPNPAFTASYSGFVNGENESVLSGSPSLTTSADEASGVAGSPYTIVAATGTLSADNYSFTFVDGQLGVTKATLMVTADAKSKIYGAVNLPFTASYSGFVNGENESVLSGSPSLTTSADATSGVAGSPYPIVAAVGTLASDNYEFSFANGMMAVTPATLGVTANDTNRVYGASNPAFTGLIVGVQNSDDITASYSTSANESSAVGNYAIVPSLNDPDGKLANYSVTMNNGTLAVTKAVLTVIADNKTKVYGAANPTFTASFSGFVDGEDQSALSGSPSLTTSADEASGVAGGPYAIVAAIGTLSANNYSFNFVNGQLTLTKAILTVLAENKSKSYGANNPMFTASYDGFVNGENESVLSGAPEFNTVATTNSTVAGSPYSIIISAGTLEADNYSFNFVNGELGVTKATLTVTAENKSKVYGAPIPALTFSYSGFVNGEDSIVLSGTPSLSTTAASNSGVAGGPYVISISLGTLSADNYDFAFVNGELSLTSAVLTVTADNKSKLYGAAVPILTASYSGFLAGDDETILSGSPGLATSANELSSVAANPYAIVAAIGTLSADNYSFDFVNGALSVTAAELTIASASTNRVYAAANPTFTGSIGGLKNGDNITASYVCAATPASAVGVYPITQSLSDPNGKLSNYSVTTNNGLLTVTAADLMVTADDKVRPYGHENPALTGVITGIQNSDDITVTYSTGATNNSPAGAYAIVPTLVDSENKLGNYNFTTNHGTLTVYDAPVISIQPVAVTTNLGATVLFSVSATGVGPLSYQWRKSTNNLADGGRISGITSASLTVNGVSVSDSGDYNVVVSNEAGSVTSSNATLVVLGLPIIVAKPMNLQVQQGENAVFNVVASGAALSYQWYFGAMAVDGATNSSLTISNAQSSNTLSGYTVVVTNEVGSVTSAPPAMIALILDEHAPRISLTTPVKNKGINQASINVTGFVKDAGVGNSGIIKSVQFALNGGATNSAAIANLAADTWTFRSINPITLTPGTNSLALLAKDLAGNETNVTVLFFYDLTNTLTLNIEGNAQVKMGTNIYNGPAANIAGVFKVGRPYKLDAFVGKGTNYIFTNWVTTPTNLVRPVTNWTQKASLSFVMQPG